MLLDHIDRYDLGHAVRLSLLSAIADGECTMDIGGRLGTREYTQAIVQRLPDYLPSDSPRITAE